MKSLEQIYRNIIGRIAALRQKQKRLTLARGLLTFLTISVVLSLSAILAEALLSLGQQGRFALVIGFCAAELFLLLWFVGRPLFSLLFRKEVPDDISLALAVGHYFSNVRDRLADALQVFQRQDQNREGYSPELTDASLSDVDVETRSLDFTKVADAVSVAKALKIAGVALATGLLIWLLFPVTLSNASYRLFNPSVDFSERAKIEFEITPGNAEVVKGEDVVLTARVYGEPIDALSLFLKNEEAKEFEQIELKEATSGEFTFTLENVREEHKYYMQAADVKSSEYDIAVIERPLARNLQAKLIYPAYSKLGSQYLDENVGDISALKGTTVELTLQTNKTLQDARIKFDDGSEVPMTISGQRVSGKFALQRNGSYHFELRDQRDLSNASPIEYRLSVVEDQHPLVEITFPGQDVDLGKDMIMPLSIEAQDDFGFTQIKLGYQILGGGIVERGIEFEKLPLPESAQDKVLLNHTWDVSNLDIQPEDVIEYFAEAVDNDHVSGPKSSRSATYRLRFPSIQEIYEEVARTHEGSFEDLESIYDESQALKSTLQEIVQEMKRDPELNWEEKQEVQDAAKNQQEMGEKLQEVQQKLDNMVDRMEQNELISLETLEKYRELQSMMQEMMTPEMKEALRKLQESMEQLDPRKLKDTMEKFAASQEEFLQNMERTLNLLKKLQIEQELDEMVRKTQDLLRRQDELNQKAAEQSEPQQGSKYAQEEQGIRKDTQSLDQEMDDLKNKMSEFPKMPQEQFESAQQQLSEQELQSLMQKAVQQFQSGEMQSAQNTGGQISESLQQMLENLQSAQKQLSQEQKQRIMQALNRSSHGLLGLSKKQEELIQQTTGADRNTPGLNEQADKQQDLLSGLTRITEQLYQVSQETFFVTPEIGKALGKATTSMQESLSDYESRNPGRAVQDQGQAMAGLNEAAAEIRKSMQNLSSSSSAIGFQEMMQRLTGISQQQQGVNQQTSQMGGQNPGGMSPQQQAAMERLASEQSAVRKSLEQLMKEAGDRSDVLGDLGQVGKEMEEVVKSLEQQNVNRQVIDKQNRILSRLLDAQRSMHKRDFSKQRQAETAKQQYTVSSPEELPQQQMTESERLRNELLRAMQEGYSKDYRELIRKYFEALAREQQNSGTTLQ